MDEELGRTYKLLQVKADKVCGSRGAIKATNYEGHSNGNASCAVTLEAGFICKPVSAPTTNGEYCYVKPGGYIVKCCNENGGCWNE